MARILYGIHGTGHGHAMRGLILARQLLQHEFLFIANDDAPKVLEPEFRVERLPNLGTVFKNYKVDLAATVAKSVPILLRSQEYLQRLLQLMDHFQPDVCMTDLEYFVPRAAKIAGLPCLTLDHQHVITCCQHHLPLDMWLDTLLQGLTPRYLFKPTETNLIISFYAPPVLAKYNALVAPPILRQSTTGRTPTMGDHLLVYQSNSTDARLLEFLKTATTRTAHVFGYCDEERKSGNLFFHQRSEEKFQELLASCAYVIQGGSHTLMSEALYYGKPVLSLPLVAMLEQRFNALYLERLGYGKKASMTDLSRRLLTDFEADLPSYKQNISKKSFCGNEFVLRLVDQYARSGKLPLINLAQGH